MKKKWIDIATRNAHGQFRKKAEEAGMSTKAYAHKEEHAKGKTGEQARLALTLMGMHHGSSAQKVYPAHK